MQNHYNLLYREEEREMNKVLRSHGRRARSMGAAVSWDHSAAAERREDGAECEGHEPDGE